MRLADLLREIILCNRFRLSAGGTLHTRCSNTPEVRLALSAMLASGHSSSFNR